MFNNSVKLLFVNVYLPYEGYDERAADFTDQLSIIENLVNDHNGGDFNAEFKRDKLHTTILNSFCDNNNLTPADQY